jgi:hypothetical protein
VDFAPDIGQRRRDALSRVDLMPPQLRECVHDFGLPIVEVLGKHGVKKPEHIREVVNMIWHGARQHGQRAGARDTLTVLLSRGIVDYDSLVSFLYDNGLVLCSASPTKAMISASMATVSNGGMRCTKEEKHRLRLMAALTAARDEMKGRRS